MEHAMPPGVVYRAARMPDGHVAVYQVAEQHAGTLADVQSFGTMLYRTHAHSPGSWYRVANQVVVDVVDRAQCLVLNRLKVDFEVDHPAWGVQVLAPVGFDDRRLQWNWLHPSRGENYRFHTKVEADICMRMCYPNALVGTVRVATHDQPFIAEDVRQAMCDERPDECVVDTPTPAV